jgi:hypothetical protein
LVRGGVGFVWTVFQECGDASEYFVGWEVRLSPVGLGYHSRGVRGLRAYVEARAEHCSNFSGCPGVDVADDPEENLGRFKVGHGP